MENIYQGETELLIGGELVVLVFDWRALAALRGIFGEEYDAKISHALQTNEMENIALILSVAAEKRQPGLWSTQKVLDASPPVIPTINAIFEAINRAYYGAEKPVPQMDRRKVNSLKTLSLRSLKDAVLSGLLRRSSGS